jgi:hypothetical protein
MGFEKRDTYFFKQMGKGMLCTYVLFGAAWLWNERRRRIAGGRSSHAPRYVMDCFDR